MNRLIQLKKTTSLSVRVLLLVCFGLAPLVRAVVPPPDGGYPNFTTAEGQNALLHLTTGAANTAVGWFSLESVTTGSFNTGIGAGTLVLNSGDENTAVGTAALLLNTASGNTAVGSRALLNNTTGGTLGTFQGTDFGPNVAIGWEALESNTTASANTAVGYQALHSFSSGPMGFEQFGLCTAIGFQALANANTSGIENTANGYKALFNNTTGTSNTASGGHALIGNITGDGNTADGFLALWHNTSGGYNTAVGSAALADNTTGMFNTALGYQAGVGLTTGDNNIHIGAGVSGDPGESNVMRIGHNQTATYIVGIFGATVGGGTPVLIDSGHKLGTMTSSQRFKQDIRPMDKTSEALLALKPVTFRYKQEIDPVGTPQFGLVAEDVEKVNPDLVVRDKEGKPYSVRYDQVNAMLLNEFLKEHRKIEQQDLTTSQLKSALTQQQKRFESKLAQQEKQIAALVADLQRLAAELELNKSEPQAVAEK